MAFPQIFGFCLAVFALMSGFGCWGEKWYLFHQNYCQNWNFWGQEQFSRILYLWVSLKIVPSYLSFFTSWGRTAQNARKTFLKQLIFIWQLDDSMSELLLFCSSNFIMKYIFTVKFITCRIIPFGMKSDNWCMLCIWETKTKIIDSSSTTKKKVPITLCHSFSEQS